MSAFIRMLEDGDADEELKRLFQEAAGGPASSLANILRIHSLDPKSLRAHLLLYRSAMAGTSGLPKVEREMIALVVSVLNRCDYCVAHHRRGLRRLARNDALVAKLEADFTTAGLDPRQRAVLDYAARLTTSPAAIRAADVQRLRDHGLSDADILAVAETCAYYAYVNRLALGLGVPLEGQPGEG